MGMLTAVQKNMSHNFVYLIQTILICINSYHYHITWSRIVYQRNDLMTLTSLLFHITLCDAILSMLLNSVRYIDEIKHMVLYES